MEDTAARFTNANFQEVSAHTTSAKDVSEARGSEGKGRNLQLTAQVKGEESLVEEIQERLYQLLVLSSKVLLMMF